MFTQINSVSRNVNKISAEKGTNFNIANPKEKNPEIFQNFPRQKRQKSKIVNQCIKKCSKIPSQQSQIEREREREIQETHIEEDSKGNFPRMKHIVLVLR